MNHRESGGIPGAADLTGAWRPETVPALWLMLILQF